MKRGTPRHPKVGRLLRELGLNLRNTATAIGHLELLWHFAAEFAPRGDIGKYDDEQIEGALHWHGKRGKLIQALTTSGWVDAHDQCRLAVHDWREHCDEATRKRLQRAGQDFVDVAVKVTGQRQTELDSVADNGSLPEPEPEPEPEPHTQEPACVRVMPRAADMASNDPPSERFEEAWALWPLKVDRDAAGQAWISTVTRSREEAAFACISRYLASDQVKRAVVSKLAGWLFQQARDGFAGDWPVAMREQSR